MDLFNNDNQPHYDPDDIRPMDISFLNLSDQSLELVEDKPSKAERFLQRALGTLKGCCAFIVIGTGLVSLIILLAPFLRFVIEFSSWSYDLVGRIFP